MSREFNSHHVQKKIKQVRIVKELEIVKTLHKNGHEAYYVGGCVRDMLLGKEPNDIDIATSATDKEVAEIFKNANLVGSSFGVSLVGGIEVASFRTESNYDGRRPYECSTGASLKEDAGRRDFTFNALYYNPITEEIKYFSDGVEHLDKKIVKFIGNADERIKEDNLRILRAIRFAVVLDFELSIDTKAAIFKNKNLLKNVPAERIVAEIKKAGNKFSLFVKMLDNFGLLDTIFGDIASLKSIEQNPEWHPEGDVFTHTMRVIDTLATDDFVLNMAGLFHDFGKLTTTAVKPNGKIGSLGHEKESIVLTRPILRKLKLSNEEVRDILWLIENHMRIKYFAGMKKSKKIALAKDPRIEKLLDLMTADAMLVSMLKESFAIRDEILNLKENRKTFIVPLVSGRDLISMGMKPGPKFKGILEEFFEIQIDEGITEKSDLLYRVLGIRF